MFHCFKDLEQAQKGCSPSSPWPHSTHKHKTNGEDEVLILQSWLFDGQSLGSEEWKKMVLVPKTLINLLLLNSNNLTHWSRERPICFLWGSVNFSAGADSVIRDDGRGGGWNQGIRCNQIFSLRGIGEGSQNLQEEALLQITADSQLCEDTGSDSLGCDWIRQTFIECLLWAESTSAS